MLGVLQKQFDMIEDRRTILMASLDALGEEQLSFKPLPDAWSIKQVIHHLMLVEKGHYPVISKKLKKPGPSLGLKSIYSIANVDLFRKTFRSPSVPDRTHPAGCRFSELVEDRICAFTFCQLHYNSSPN
jgi:hypothetical protein